MMHLQNLELKVGKTMTYNDAILELVKIQDTIMVDRDDNKRMDVKIKPLYTRIVLYTTGVRSIIIDHIANFEDIINTIKKEMQ